MSKNKGIVIKNDDEMMELKKFYNKNKKEQEALRKLLEQLNKRGNDGNLKTNI